LSSGLIARLLDGWFDISHGGKFIAVPVLDFDVVELFKTLAVNMGKDDFLDFFFGENNFHDAPWLGPKPRG